MSQGISNFKKILLCAIMLCHNSGLLAMQAEDFPYDPVSLLKENQHLLVEWIHKEAQGTFCPELRLAKKALSKMFLNAKENEGMFVGDGFLQESVDRARYVVEAKKCRRQLKLACDMGDLDEIAKIVEKSPYSIQACSYRSPYRIDERHSILYKAVELDYPLSVIEALLKMGACPNGITSKRRFSSLHMARKEPVLKLLLKYGADINYKDSKGKNPLWKFIFWWPIHNKNYRNCVVDYFLRHRADVYCANKDGMSLIQKALDRGGLKESRETKKVDYLMIKSLLDYASGGQQWDTFKGALIESSIASDNTYWFKFARIHYIPFDSTNGDCAIIDCIKNKGEFLKAMDLPSDEHDRLIYDVAQLFLTLNNAKARTENDGITINSKGYLFQNASYDDLAKIVGKDSVEFVKAYILECSQKISDSIESTKSKHASFFALGYDQSIAFQTIKRMMRWNKKWFNQECEYHCFEQTDEKGNTLLHLCADPLYHSKEAMEWLMKNGIDFTIKNNDGLTAFDLADKMKGKKILVRLMELAQQFFFEQGSCQSSKKYNNFLNTLIVIASRYPLLSYRWLCTFVYSRNLVRPLRYGWIQQLLANGQAYINTVDFFKSSLLYYAIKAENKETVLLLLSHGALVREDMMTKAISTLKDALKKAYEDQKCSMCCKYVYTITDIPCSNYHLKQYICAECYDDLPMEEDMEEDVEEENVLIKKCPLCQSALLPDRWKTLRVVELNWVL